MGAKLIILASHSMKVSGLPLEPEYVARRQVDTALLYKRLEDIAADLGIPLIDQSATILKLGHDLQDASWRFDGHWNPFGHISAAYAIKEWLETQSGVCGQQRQ
jgi:hypothetical protein